MIPKTKFIVDQYLKIEKEIIKTICNIKEGKHTILLQGSTGVGKTALIAECAMKS